MSSAIPTISDFDPYLSSSDSDCENDSFQYDMDDTAGLVNQVGREMEIGVWPKRKRYLLSNPLSRFWTRQAVYENPRRIVGLAFCYVLGMAGYALALLTRVGVLVIEILRLLGFVLHACCGNTSNFLKNLKVRLLCLLGATGELVSGVVGLVCPPLAYEIDEKIQDNNVIHVHAFFGAREELDRGGYLAALFTNFIDGNETSVINKQVSVNSLRSDLHKTQTTMKKYLMEESLFSFDLQSTKQIFLIGLLHKFKKNLAQNSHADFLDPLNTYLQEYHSKGIFGDKINSFQTCWSSLQQNYAINEIIDKLILRAVLDTVAEGSLIDKDDFLEGKYEELQTKLDDDGLSNLDSFNSLYDALSNIPAAILQSDNEVYKSLCSWFSETPSSSLREKFNNWWIHLGSG